jgi:hypothetical protein
VIRVIGASATPARRSAAGHASPPIARHSLTRAASSGIVRRGGHRRMAHQQVAVRRVGEPGFETVPMGLGIRIEAVGAEQVAVLRMSAAPCQPLERRGPEPLDDARLPAGPLGPAGLRVLRRQGRCAG